MADNEHCCYIISPNQNLYCIMSNADVNTHMAKVYAAITARIWPDWRLKLAGKASSVSTQQTMILLFTFEKWYLRTSQNSEQYSLLFREDSLLQCLRHRASRAESSPSVSKSLSLSAILPAISSAYSQLPGMLHSVHLFLAYYLQRRNSQSGNQNGSCCMCLIYLQYLFIYPRIIPSHI